ncbi:unnamed protein product [Owenia fusiformis]|uniref:Uncharacterized protein n=1 Tax=Owenia fusiformis TaxID=6347 RepID=A0A8J1TC34_OWEFU|nr:unnamed protein product [Owenia fusiformis]
MTCVPCVTWVKRGVAKERPDKVQLNPEELAELIKESKEEIGDLDGDDENMDTVDLDPREIKSSKKHKIKKEKKAKPDEDDDDDDAINDEEDDDIVKAYGLDDYDDEDADDGDPLSIGGLTFYASNAQDPYITLKEDSDDEEEASIIKPTDNLVVVAKAQNEFCNLQVFVYNENEGDLYGHHDIYLPAYPLAIECMNFDPGTDKPGNLVAVGSMEPTIDIWDMDIMESIEPALTLGTKQSKKKKKSKKKGALGGHTDAVLDLSWNHHARNVLASASADYTVALWDMSQGTAVTTLRQHKEKVQTIQWHPYEPQSLLSGGFDKSVIVYDCRSPEETHRNWKLGGEIERVVWDHFNPTYFLASTDQGYVYYVDSRTDKPVFTLNAHSGAVTALSLSSQVRGCLVTGSEDKAVKVWDIADSKPSCVTEKNMKIGPIQCASCCPESGFIFAVSGEKEFRVWDIRDNTDVRGQFEGRSASASEVSSAPNLEMDTVDALDDLCIDTEEKDTDGKDAIKTETENVVSFSAKSTDSTASSTASKTKKKRKKKKK